MKKVKDEFKVSKNKIGYVWDSFIKEFGDDEITAGSVLKSQTLSRDMTDAEIIKELSIEECTLGDILTTLKNATEEMKDGYSNLFYIKDHPSRVVDVRWCGGGWGVDYWGRGVIGWSGGSRVFSPATGPQSSSTLGSDALTLAKLISDIEQLLKKYK